MSNVILSTENLADTSAWTANSTTVTSNTHAAPAFAGGSAGLADTVADNSGAAQGNILGSYITGIPADTNPSIGSVYVRKDANTTRWPDIGFQINSGVSGYVTLNTSTGAIADGPFASPSASGIVDVDANWWRVWIKLINNGSGTDVRMLCYPDHVDALGGGSTSGGTGSVILWGFNVTNTATVQTYDPQPFYSFGGSALGAAVNYYNRLFGRPLGA